jgi:hypothetical protein
VIVPVRRFQDFKISRFQDFKISRFQDFNSSFKIGKGPDPVCADSQQLGEQDLDLGDGQREVRGLVREEGFDDLANLVAIRKFLARGRVRPRLMALASVGQRGGDPEVP